MRQSSEFRAGQRVRVRATADSDFAGHYGVILHVGRDVCDVRIRYKAPGSRVRSTYIGTFDKRDLETFTRPVDLAMFHPRDRANDERRHIWIYAALIAILFVIFCIFLIQYSHA